MGFFDNWPCCRAKKVPEQAFLTRPEDMLDPSRWQIGPIVQGENKSKQMPPTPMAPWHFMFPTGDGVHYVTMPARLFKRFFIRFRIEAPPGTVFQSYDQGQPELTPAAVRLYVQGNGSYSEVWIGPGRRYWNTHGVALQDGEFSLEGDLTNLTSDWSGVMGPEGSRSQFLSHCVGANMARIGFTFGGRGYGHGVGIVAGGPAKFSLLECKGE